MADKPLATGADEGDPKDPSFADFAAQNPGNTLCDLAGRLLASVANSQQVDVGLLEQILVPVFVDIRANPAAQLSWYFPKPLKDYRPLHALNACRLAMYFARASNMDDARVVQLGAIGLLYDAGMWLPGIPPVLEARTDRKSVV